MIVSSPQSLRTRSGSARCSQRASSRTRPGASSASSSRVRPSQPTARPLPALRGMRGSRVRAQRQGGQGRHGKLHRKGVLQEVEMEQAPVLGLHRIPGAGPEAAGVEIGGGDVQVAVVAGHLTGERPQPLPHPGQQAVGLDLQGHHRDFPAGPQVPAPGADRPGAASPSVPRSGPGTEAAPEARPDRDSRENHPPAAAAGPLSVINHNTMRSWRG